MAQDVSQFLYSAVDIEDVGIETRMQPEDGACDVGCHENRGKGVVKD